MSIWKGNQHLENTGHQQSNKVRSVPPGLKVDQVQQVMANIPAVPSAFSQMI